MSEAQQTTRSGPSIEALVEGIEYIQQGDYLIPNLTLGDQPTEPVGKYGLLRKKYLAEHKRARNCALYLKGEHQQHLLDIDREAREMKERLMAQLLASDPLPQTTDTMALTAHRNRLEMRAEEIVLNEVVYS